MDQATCDAVDAFISERLLGRDEDLEGALARSAAAGLPAIQVSPPQGKLLRLLARLQQARYVLEIGTLGGYSTIWLAAALPFDGRMITLELEPRHAEVARESLAAARLAETVEVRVGPALESLAALAEEGLPPFDLVFVDADKAGYPEYFKWAVKLARRGALLVFDNAVRGGRVLDAASADAGVQGIRRLYELVAAEPRVTATAIQTVGVKGYDGLLIALVAR